MYPVHRLHHLFDYRGCPQMLPHAIRQKDPAKNIESRKDMTLFLLVLPLHLPSFFFDSLKVIHFDTAVSEYSREYNFIFQISNPKCSIPIAKVAI